MAFDREYFTKMGYGGKGGNSVWHYYDYNSDNCASIGAGVVNTTYFKPAYVSGGIVARPGDIILCLSRTDDTGSVNTATPCVFGVPSTWDANGASVVLAYQ